MDAAKYEDEATESGIADARGQRVRGDEADDPNDAARGSDVVVSPLR